MRLFPESGSLLCLFVVTHGTKPTIEGGSGFNSSSCGRVVGYERGACHLGVRKSDTSHNPKKTDVGRRFRAIACAFRKHRIGRHGLGVVIARLCVTNKGCTGRAEPIISQHRRIISKGHPDRRFDAGITGWSATVLLNQNNTSNPCWSGDPRAWETVSWIIGDGSHMRYSSAKLRKWAGRDAGRDVVEGQG